MHKRSMDELGRPNIAQFKQQAKLPVTLILDNVRSMHNVGAIFRTADGFGVEKIILCGITGRPPHREIEKTALGATLSVDWEYQNDVAEAIQTLKKQQYTIFAVEQAKGSTWLHQLPIYSDKGYALIFGNEVHGVSDTAIQLVDGCIEIPQVGTKHSFNVVVSAGVVLWQFFEKWYQDPA